SGAGAVARLAHVHPRDRARSLGLVPGSGRPRRRPLRSPLSPEGIGPPRGGAPDGGRRGAARCAPLPRSSAPAARRRRPDGHAGRDPPLLPAASWPDRQEVPRVPRSLPRSVRRSGPRPGARRLGELDARARRLKTGRRDARCRLAEVRGKGRISGSASSFHDQPGGSRMTAQRGFRWHSLVPGMALAAVVGVAAGCGKEAADKGAGAATAQPAAPATVALIRAADWIGAEWSEDALKVGLDEEGMEPGRDYVFKASSAQGDLATLPNLVDAALDAKAKIIVTLQDATLQVAVKRVKDTPIVFDILSDPFAAGAGTSDSVHLPNVTGVYSPGFGDPEQERRIELIKRVAPKARRVGVLFTPGEQLSVDLKNRLGSAAKKAKLDVVAVPLNTPSDAA